VEGHLEAWQPPRGIWDKTHNNRTKYEREEYKKSTPLDVYKKKVRAGQFNLLRNLESKQHKNIKLLPLMSKVVYLFSLTTSFLGQEMFINVFRFSKEKGAEPSKSYSHYC